MALDTEAKRWSMLQLANGPSSYSHVINPTGSDFDSQVERFTLLHIYGGDLAVVVVIAGGTFNAAEYFPTGQSDVVITLYDPEATGSTPISLTSDVCIEIGSTGVYIWDLSKITTLPTPRKEFAYVMTDGATLASGIITYDDFLIQYIIHEEMDLT